MVLSIPDCQGTVSLNWAESQRDPGGVAKVNDVLENVLHVHLTGFFIKANPDQLLLNTT